MIRSILIIAIRKVPLDKMKCVIFGSGRELLRENSSSRCKRGIRIM